jgi:hypothetical protein
VGTDTPPDAAILGEIKRLLSLLWNQIQNDSVRFDLTK